jgi:hypothetical protein
MSIRVRHIDCRDIPGVSGRYSRLDDLVLSYSIPKGAHRAGLRCRSHCQIDYSSLSELCELLKVVTA